MNTPITGAIRPASPAISLAQSPSAALCPSVFSTQESGIIQQALGIIEAKRLRNAPVLYYLDDFERYLILRFAGFTNEQAQVLYLDIDRRLLSAETEFFGNQSRVNWDMRKVVLRAITLGAEHLVFAHNHPGGNATPSNQDVEHLSWTEAILTPLAINLLDSFVVTSSRITSIKDYRKRQEEEKQRQMCAEWDRQSAERKAKRDAKRAAKQATQLQGV